MPKEHRLTAGHYGAKRRRLSRDDFAGIVFTLVPADEPGSADSASTPAPVKVPQDLLDSARQYGKALAGAWPEEPIAVLADTVAALLANPGGAGVGPGPLYAAALLCDEEAARTDAAGDRAAGSDSNPARAVSARLKAAAAAAGPAVEAAFDA